MGITENRTSSEVIVEKIKSKDNDNTGGDKSASSSVGTSKDPTYSQYVEETPKGMIKNLPASLGQYSSFKELTSEVQSITSSVKSTINNALTVPNIDEINQKISGLAGEYNLNQNIVNQALAVTKAILCGDSDALVFDLSAIIRALDYDFDFLRSWNICGRQKMRNPIDTLLKGIDNLERQTALIGSIGPRFMNNLKGAVKSFLNNAGLPASLATCLTQKSLLQGSSTMGHGLSLGRLKDLIRSTSPSICKNSEAGVRPNNYTIRKVAAQPFVTGIVEYDRVSMYSFYTGIIDKEIVEKQILLEILSESFSETKNPNTIKTLELIAYTKVAEVFTKDTIATSISSINKELHNYNGSDDIILDKILQAIDDGVTIRGADVTNIKGDYLRDFVGPSQFDAIQILESMEDDFSESQDPSKDFNNAVRLLTIADTKFDPNANVDKLSSCASLGDLAVKGMMTTKLPDLTNSTRTIGTDTFLVVEDDGLELEHHVGIMRYADTYEEPTLEVS